MRSISSSVDPRRHPAPRHPRARRPAPRSRRPPARAVAARCAPPGCPVSRGARSACAAVPQYRPSCGRPFVDQMGDLVEHGEALLLQHLEPLVDAASSSASMRPISMASSGQRAGGRAHSRSSRRGVCRVAPEAAQSIAHNPLRALAWQPRRGGKGPRSPP